MSSHPPTSRRAAIAALVALLSGTVSAQDAPKPPESPNAPSAPSPQEDSNPRPRDRTTQVGGRRGGDRGGDRGGRGSGRGPRATADLATAQNVLLESESPTDRDFMQLVQAATQESTNRKLPSLYENAENTYGPEHRALRAEVYGPLLEQPRTREYLRSLARKPAGSGWDYTSATAALVLADAPDEQDFDALFEGYQGTAPEQRASIARQLGRAIAAMPANPRTELALARLRADAAEGKPAQRGAAIEGLFRAGLTREAAEVLEPLLAGQQDPLDAVTLLQACSRLFQRPELDPFMKARAIATAETAIEMLLDSDEDVTPMQVISGKGRTLRAAIAFLQDVGGGAEIPLFLRCLDSERAQRLLGMDGLQNLRFALQSRRSKATPEQGAKLDERWLSILVDAGNRLFALEEEPMEPEEKAAFWDARDLRYNALSYFCDQFRRTQDAGPSVKERIGKEPDLPALLATFVHAKEDVLEEGSEDGAGARYTAVTDKVENRALALQLLALIEREWNRDPGGLDVFAEAYAILCTEIHAPILPVEQVVAFRRAREAGRMLSIPVGLAPDDAFVQNAAAQAIANLGYVVHTGPHLIQIEVDTEYPWPWPADSTSTAGGSQVGGKR